MVGGGLMVNNLSPEQFGKNNKKSCFLKLPLWNPRFAFTKVSEDTFHTNKKRSIDRHHVNKY